MLNNGIPAWQSEIISEDDLLDEYGELKYRGFARKPYLKYSRKAIKAKKSRIKEWDYYLIQNEDGAVCLTIDDNSYMGMLSVSIIDLKEPSEITKSKIIWNTKGTIGLGESSEKEGVVEVNNKNIHAKFEIVKGKRVLSYKWTNYHKKQDLEVEIVLKNQPKESMVIATPFNKPGHFYYNHKILGFKPEGSVKLGGKEILKFTPENSHALLDWGRGVWTYSNTWIWGAFMGKVNNHELGINLGYGFGNTDCATENMLFYDGKAHKLNHVYVDFNNGKKEEYVFPFKVSSNDGRLEGDFLPIIDRHANTNALVIASNQHQIFGIFNGKAVLDDGEEIEFENLYGFIEKVKNRW